MVLPTGSLATFPMQRLLVKTPSDFQTCIDKGSWLGKETIDITIIDSPEFPFKSKDQQRMINDLVNTLRKEIRSTNIFIITFNQWAINMSYSSRMILSSLYRIF